MATTGKIAVTIGQVAVRRNQVVGLGFLGLETTNTAAHQTLVASVAQEQSVLRTVMINPYEEHSRSSI